MTNNIITQNRRIPAEWEHHGAVMVALPHKDTDWEYMLAEVTECYRNVIACIAKTDKVLVLTPDKKYAERILNDILTPNVILVEVLTNDTWARDFGPLTMVENGEIKLMDFQFNGWGLKFAACHDNLITSRLETDGLFSVPVENHRDFVLEGGSIESDGCGTLLTTSECLLSPNRNALLNKAEIEQYLIDAFGLKKVLWLDSGALEGDDTDSHIDTLCRMAPNDTILYTGTARVDDSHYGCLKAMYEQLTKFTTIEGKAYNLIELPLPDAVYDSETGERLPATYANYLVLSDRILMPSYNQPANDRLAADTLRVAYPQHTVETIDCRPLIRQHGSLHCITMQLPVNALNI